MEAEIAAIPADKLGAREGLFFARPVEIFADANTEEMGGSEAFPWVGAEKCGGGSVKGFDESCGSAVDFEEASAGAWAEAGSRSELILEIGRAHV